MSDPVTNAEIEDVLSSIRRLVSDDARSLARSRPLSQPVEPERLVLTPALRVTPELVAEALPDPEPEYEPEAESENAADVSDKVDLDPFLLVAKPQEAVDPVAEDVVDAAEEAFAPDVEAIEEVERVEESGATGEAEDDLQQDEGAFTAAEAEVEVEETDQEEPWSDPETTLYEAAAAYEETDGAPMDADIADVPAETEWASEEVGETGQDAERTWSEVPEEDVGASVEFHDHGADEVAAGEEQHEDDAAEDQPAHDLSGTVEVLGAAISGREEDWEPDGGWEPAGSEDVALDPPFVETVEWQDAGTQTKYTFGSAPDEAGPDPVADDFPPGAGEAGFPDDEDDAELSLSEDLVMDEAMLREIVTDIVREELQGALGERITRNVRKLVRREINRALSVQELE